MDKMKAISVKNIGTNGKGQRIVDAFILADMTPDTLPTTGADIIGLDENCVFAPFSVLYVANDAPAKLYIADTSGKFVAQ